MKLTRQEQDIYDFCLVGRTAHEIMEFVGHKTPPYKALKYMQGIGAIQKVSDYETDKAVFVQSGTVPKPEAPPPREPMIVFGVRI